MMSDYQNYVEIVELLANTPRVQEERHSQAAAYRDEAVRVAQSSLQRAQHEWAMRERAIGETDTLVRHLVQDARVRPAMSQEVSMMSPSQLDESLAQIRSGAETAQQAVQWIARETSRAIAERRRRGLPEGGY